MIGCEEKRTADAEFADQILCHNAVQWSKDNRISVCTEKGISIMEMKHSPLQLDKKFHYNFTQIPCPDKPNNVTGLPLNVFRSWKTGSSGFSDDEMQELHLEQPLHPYIIGQVVNLGYVRAKWSPTGVDIVGRCALATITGDHRLSIYVTGNDRKKFKQVFDLNSMLFERYKDKVSKNMTFSDFKDVSYSMFAVDVAWSSLRDYEDVSYLMMAVAMKNGIIKLLKISTPLCSKDDVIFASEVHPLSAIPSSLCWCPGFSKEKGYVAVGYQSGQVVNVAVNCRKVSLESLTTLHKDEDHIQVGSIACYQISEERLLLIVAKEIHVLTFLIDMMTGVKLENKLYSEQLSFAITSLTPAGELLIMSSEDGELQIVTPAIGENGTQVHVKFSTLTSDFTEIRKILGASSSPNELFVFVGTWPLRKFDLKVMKRRPMHVYTLLLKSEEETRKITERLLLDETVPMKLIPDALEYFRQCLWSGVNIIPSLTNFVTRTNMWFSMNVKLLRVLRYFVLTIQLHIPETTDEEIKEAALAKGTVSALSEVIMLKYTEKVFDALLRSPQREFTQTEMNILGMMLKWVEGRQEKCPSPHKVEEVQKLVNNRNHSDCFICHSSLTEEGLTWVCHNGHIFGMCCLTFLPCSTTYRTCANCNFLALPAENIKEIPWMTEEECSLCGGMLF
ncbi:general transcription factor 3C polypeptide 4-like isoform X1 [Crassostrea virginica]